MAVKVILRFTNGRLQDQERTFTGPARCFVGRSNDCDIQIPSSPEFLGVSRYHCLLDIDPPTVQVRDLGSRNGCFVNGRRIREHRLRDGDLIAVGHHQMRFAGPNGKARMPASPQLAEEADTTLVGTRVDALGRSSSH